MTCTLKVSKGIIALPPGVNLPDGAEVQVILPDSSFEQQSLADHLAEFIGAADDLPADMAENVDHYAHGHPKKVKVVFADAFYLIGLLNPADYHHAKCLAVSRQTDIRIVTTTWVLMELGDSLAKTKSRRLVAPYIERLGKFPQAKIIPVSEELFQRGLQLYHSRQDKSWTLTDCISFVVMADEKIAEALTGDRHFEQAGFEALLA